MSHWIHRAEAWFATSHSAPLGLFLAFNLCFSLFYPQIGAVIDACCLAGRRGVHARIRVTNLAVSGLDQGKRRQGGKKSVRTVNSHLPKTLQPYVTYTPPGAEPAPAPWPPLREYNGDDFTKEKTTINVHTDGANLYVEVLAADKDVDRLVTQHTKDVPVGQPWMDDSIEFFIIPDMDHPEYYQVCVSCTGRYCIGVFENSRRRGIIVPLADKEFPGVDIEAGNLDDGYVIHMKLPTAAFALPELRPGQSFFAQFVRNYRGPYGASGAHTLQLFPVHIYADNRHGARNHHRRAFRRLSVVAPDDVPASPPPVAADPGDDELAAKKKNAGKAGAAAQAASRLPTRGQ